MIYDICISLIILSFVPIIVLSSEIVINYIFNTPKNTINMFEMLIYILLLICGIIVLFYFMKKYINNDSVKFATSVLIGPLINITSQHLNESVIKYIFG